MQAALVKAKGDELLAAAPDPGLRGRRLSLTDAAVIVAAGRRRALAVTGDRDLMYVASHTGVEAIWWHAGSKGARPRSALLARRDSS